jgi:hypothetical protein
MSARGFFSAIALAFASWAASASADDSAASVRIGIDRYVHGDYEAARVAFAHAFDVSPSARTLFNLALAEFESGHLVESVHHMRGYLVELDAEPDKVEALRTKWLPRAEAQTSRLEVDAPDAADIILDGVPQGHAPVPAIDVSVGPHDVVVQLGAWSHAERVTARPGELLQVHFDASSESAAPTAGLAVGGSVGTRPPSKGWPPAKRLAVITLGASTLVAASLGVAFAVVSKQDASAGRDLLSQLPADQMQAQCTESPLSGQCLTIQADNQSAHNTYELSNAFYVGAGVLAGATLLTALVWPSHASAEPAPAVAGVVPLLGGDHVGLSFAGAW